MVMSMDAVAGDQSLGSPMDDSNHHAVRHQESVEDEANEDEQSKASGQTVVVKTTAQQQQVQQKPVASATIRASDSVLTTDEQQGRERDPSVMLVSREPSLDDDIKLMMTDDRRQDPAAMVSRMRNIVEGRLDQHQNQQKQQKNSSGDSLNHGTTENNSKASQDSAAQQKRSRHAHHCNRHHHHHHNHQHRQSVGTIVSQTSSCHHHHHHHLKSGLQQQQQAHHHHHHRHHHHHHDHEQLTTQSAATGGKVSTKRISNQRPEASNSQTDTNQQQANSSSSFMPLDQIGANLDCSNKTANLATNESKSSTSSVSSAPQMVQGHHQGQAVASFNKNSNIIHNDSNLNLIDQHQNTNNNDSLVTAANEENLAKHPAEHCANHANHGHHHHQHHHHADTTGASQHPHHHHHYHGHGGNGRHHHHHHHHRKYRKRLVLDAESQSTNIPQQQESPSINTGHRLAGTDNKMVSNETETNTNNEQNPSEKREPLRDLETNVTSSTSCLYHEHQCPSHGARGTNLKLHPHHHHHHHHNHQHHHRGDKDDATTTSGDHQQQSSLSNRGHHHHHHHHHHRHHHHQQHSRQRNRKHRSSSNKNLDEQMSGKETAGGADPEGLVMDDYDRRQSQPVSAFQHRKSSETIPKSELESKMLLDDEGLSPNESNNQSNTNEANNEVVNMDMSPNNEKPKNAILVGDPNAVSSTTADEANLITSIEIIDSAQGANYNQEKEKSSGPKGANDSDIDTQGASGAQQSTNDESAHEFTRSREGDSVKGNHDKSSQFVRQQSSSREISQKENTRRASGNRQDQQIIECLPLTSDTYQLPSQPKQIVESTVSPDRRCRLCWCCCCPCSALSNRNNQSKSEAKPVVTETSSSPANKCPALPNVPLEKIRSWGDSFDRLMKCPDGRKVFQDFLRCEYSEENILFWIACEELKNEKDAKSIAAKARDIYEDYISILSAKEVSLDSRVRDIINNNIKKPTSNIFDEAQLQIYTLMHRDSYPRFINSPMYKKLAQIQTSSRKSSS